MHNTRRIVKNSAAQALAFGSRIVSTLIIYFFIARTADGPELLGRFVVLITLIGLFEFLSTFGLAELLAREFARLRADLPQVNAVMNAAVGLVILLSCLAGMLMVVTSSFMGYSGCMLWASLIATLTMALDTIVRIVIAAFSGFEEMEHNSAVMAVTELAFVVAGMAVLLMQPNIMWLMIAYAAARLVGLGLTIHLYGARFGGLQPAIDKQRWLHLLKAGAPFAINHVLSLAYVRLDVIILTFFVTTVEIGFYESATGLTIRLNIIARALNLAMLPFLSWKYVSGTQPVSKYTARAIHYLVIIGFPCAAVLSIFSEEIIGLLYGKQFLPAADALRLMALIVPLRMIDNSMATMLTASNRQVKRTIAIAVAAAVNIVLNFILIPSHGIMGAVFSTVITEVVLLIFFAGFMRHELMHIIQWQVFAAPTVGVLLMAMLAAVLHPLNIWILSGVLMVGLYLLTIYLADRSVYVELSGLAVKRKNS